MDRQEARTASSGTDEMPLTAVHPVALASAAFALGFVTGLFVKDAAMRTYDRSRRVLWHRDSERAVTYRQNLPESLARREPVPHSGQPRYGGTGAIGVSPAAVIPGRPEEKNDAPREQVVF